jgi:3-dehydroquinate synthase
MPPSSIVVGPPGPRQYRIDIGHGLASSLWARLDELGLGRQRIVVSTSTIWRFVASSLDPAAQTPAPLLVPDGERFKHLGTVSRLYDGFFKASADRASTIVAVGGGVLGDTAGFAAATFLRGIAIVHVPTTLLAQVDSAIGGKVGVNHALGKNLIGAFHPPRAVVVDPVVLATLPRREFRAGLYEVLKYAVIASPGLFATLQTRLGAVFARDPDVLVPLLSECCGIKARIVTADEHEHGERRLLNFGHTAAHALETVTRYRRFRHGEAVAWGMLVAARLASARGVLSQDGFDALAAVVTQMGPLPAVTDLSIDEVLEVVGRDKKVVAGRLHFVLPTAIGHAEVVTDVGHEELAAALRATGLKG